MTHFPLPLLPPHPSPPDGQSYSSHDNSLRESINQLIFGQPFPNS